MFNFDINENNKRVHFIGIGGVSMSALAEYLHSEGFTVSGSDMNKSARTEKLENDGIKVYYGHCKDNVNDVDLVIYTDAISTDNEELRAAMKNKTVIVDRAEFLGQLMKEFNFSIAVSGTHGKTTTTSMLTEIIYDHDPKPTIMLGGNLNRISGNIQIGEKDLFLTEACEYKGNIEKYFPRLAIILNIDEDHLDFFDNIDHIIRIFENFAENLTENDFLLLNKDDKNSASLVDSTKAKVYTFAVNNIADYSVKNIIYDDLGFPSFEVYKGKRHYLDVKLSVLGNHNISNAIAAIAAADIYGINKETIADRISKYTGVDRRLQYKGEVNGVEIIDDYAHHPTEIKVTLEATRNRYSSNIYCIFQPHTYTRTKLLLKEFSQAFTNADKIIITDIYAAREKDYGDIHSKMLVDAIVENGDDAIYVESFEEIEKYLINNARPGDCILTMGAGDVYKIGDNIIKAGEDKKVAIN